MSLELLPNYDLHKSTDNILEKFSSDQEAKICRYCHRKYPDATFASKPHLIPELFGRNSITCNFECDDCNTRFQKFESDASHMIQHYLGLLNIPTKNGVPVFQSGKTADQKSTTLKRDGLDVQLNFGRNAQDFKIDQDRNTLTVYFRTKNFRPFSVYKLFLKMGISLLTEGELNANEHYFDFLNSEKPIENGMQHWTAYRYMLKTKYHDKPKVNLYRAKQTLIGKKAYPEYMLLLNFSNIVFQFFLPVSTKNLKEFSQKNGLTIELFPAFLLEDITRLKEVDIHQLDLSKTDKGSITDKVVLYYDSRTTS
jgi:hypothetical protein